MTRRSTNPRRLLLLAIGWTILAGNAAAQAQDPAGEIRLRFTFGSEKEKWLREVTDGDHGFHRAAKRTRQNKLIKVDLVPMGSGKLMQEVLDAEHNLDRKDLPRTHLISPASEIYIRLANAGMLDRATSNAPRKDRSIVGATRSLVRSPVVIAMWEDKARLLGWGNPDKAPGWAKVVELARSKDGWADIDINHLGQFIFGYTNPEYSNSGLIAVIAQVYASTGKKVGLTKEDVAKKKTRDDLSDLAKKVVHYGESTGFFGDKMLASDPKELHAAVLYENMVIQSYDDAGKPKSKHGQPIVAIYPGDGTFWSDHPAGVVDAWWMDEEHREAAEIYIQFLCDKPRQVMAMNYGFRPGDTEVALGKRFSMKFGVDPARPRKEEELEIPDLDVIAAIRDLWRQIKKKSDVVLAIDVSNSMVEDDKIGQAKKGAAKVIDVLGDEDRLSILTFGDKVTWEREGLVMDKANKVEATRLVEGLKTQNRTALYDGALEAYQGLLPQAGPDRISAVIVLSDGKDTVSKIDFAKLQNQLQFNLNKPVIIITIAYGKDADPKVLKQIGDLGRGPFFTSTPDNIKEVMEKAAAIFSSGSTASATR